MRRRSSIWKFPGPRDMARNVQWLFGTPWRAVRLLAYCAGGGVGAWVAGVVQEDHGTVAAWTTFAAAVLISGFLFWPAGPPEPPDRDASD